MQEIVLILQRSNSIFYYVEIARKHDILQLSVTNPGRKARHLREIGKKGKHVTIQEDERQYRNVHRAQHSKYHPSHEDHIEGNVIIITTRSRKKPLVQQYGSSTERSNEQHSDVETSLSEYSHASLIRHPKVKSTLGGNIVPITNS